MLKAYYRHVEGCEHAPGGTKYDPKDPGTLNSKCGCPIWVDGMHEGKRCRHSLDTRNQEEAARKVLEIIAGGAASAPAAVKNCSVDDAIKDFLDDGRSRNLAPSSIDRYESKLAELNEFCKKRGITLVRGLDYSILKAFVRSIDNAPGTIGSKIDVLRSFLKHCYYMGWCSQNAAKKVRKPKVTKRRVLPFTFEQHLAILAATEQYPVENLFGHDNRARMKAFTLTLRYTALRVGDALQLRPEMITNGKLFLRTTKNGKDVWLPLPEELLDALKAIQRGSANYFWTGRGKIKTAVGDWERRFAKLLRIAGVAGHPHMYRHMVAIELLEGGVLVEHVAMILGDTVATIYRHYNVWIESRQKALEIAVQRLRSSQQPPPVEAVPTSSVPAAPVPADGTGAVEISSHGDEKGNSDAVLTKAETASESDAPSSRSHYDTFGRSSQFGARFNAHRVRARSRERTTDPTPNNTEVGR